MSMPTHLEQIPIVLLPLDSYKGESDLLGTYIDCAISAPTSYAESGYAHDRAKDVEILPIKTLNYSLNHIKDTTDKEQSLSIGLEVILKALMVEINIASVQYNTKYNSKMEKEHLQIYYYREDRVERLLPSQDVFDKITAEFGPPPPQATHIVSEVYYGVSMVADVVIETQKTTKMVNKTATGLGAVIIGPISAGIEGALKAVLGNPADKVSVDIKVTSTHGDYFGEETTVEQLFTGIKDLHKVEKGDMKPLKMFCVPIAQFLPDDIPENKKVPIISDYFMQPLVQMMETLTDFQDETVEDEDGSKSVVASSYLSAKMLDRDVRLRMILKDPEYPITIEVNKRQDEYNGFAKKLYDDGKKLSAGISAGTTTETAIGQLLTEYQNHEVFKLEKIYENIEAFIRDGKRELSLINADDVDEYTEAKFVSSLTDLKAERETLYRGREGEPVFSVELQTNQDGGKEVPNGLFLSAYNLSSKMDVFVVMPNTTGTNFCLKLHKSEEEIFEVTDFEDIMIVLDILSVAFGVTGGPVAKWYQALASEFDCPIALPLLNTIYDENFCNFLKTIIVGGTVIQKYKDVKIFPTFMSLKSHLMDTRITDFESKVMICLPVSSYVPLIDGIEAFKHLMNLELTEFPNKDKYEFLIGEFDLGSDDAPLLLVFQEGKLEASCLAWLDFLRLKQTIQDVPSGQKPNFSSLTKTSSTFFPLRTEYHRELNKLFKFSLYQKPTLVLHPEVLKTDDRVKVETALEICAAYLAIDSREQRMVTTLTKKLLELEEDYLKRFDLLGWSVVLQDFTSSDIFGDDQRKALRGYYLDLLFESSSPLLTKLGAFYHTLDFSIQSDMAKQPTPYPYTELLAMISNNVLDDLEVAGAESIIKELRSLLASPTLDMAEKAFKLTQELVLQPNFADGASAIVPHLQSILSVLPLPTEPEAPPTRSAEHLRRITRWKETSEDAFLSILTKFVDQVWPESDSEIKDWLSKRLVLKIANELGRKRYPEWHQNISAQFRDLECIKDYKSLMTIIEGISTVDGVELDLIKQKQFIWSNPPFGKMILDAFEFEGKDYKPIVFKAIQTDENPSIPDYIITSIARQLRQFLFLNDDGTSTRRLLRNRQVRIQKQLG